MEKGSYVNAQTIYILHKPTHESWCITAPKPVRDCCRTDRMTICTPTLNWQTGVNACQILAWMVYTIIYVQQKTAILTKFFYFRGSRTYPFPDHSQFWHVRVDTWCSVPRQITPYTVSSVITEYRQHTLRCVPCDLTQKIWRDLTLLTSISA